MKIYPYAPGHQNVDTSMAAAVELAPKLGRLQKMALAAVRNAGSNGLTSDELAELLGTERWSFRPRISELRQQGLIRDSGRRRLNKTGRMAIVWIAA